MSKSYVFVLGKNQNVCFYSGGNKGPHTEGMTMIKLISNSHWLITQVLIKNKTYK